MEIPLPELPTQPETTQLNQQVAEAPPGERGSPRRAPSGDIARQDGQAAPGRQLRSAAERRPPVRYRDYDCT